MIEKLSLVIIGVCTAFVLSLTGYVSGLEPPDQPPSVGLGIRLGMVGFMALYTAILLIFLKFYPLGKERVAEISKKVEKIHAEKAKKAGEDGQSGKEHKRLNEKSDLMIKK